MFRVQPINTAHILRAAFAITCELCSRAVNAGQEVRTVLLLSHRYTVHEDCYQEAKAQKGAT